MYYLCGITLYYNREMKKMKSWMLAAILLCGAGQLTSCNGNGNTNAAADKAATDTAATAAVKAEAIDHSDAFLGALDNYLVDSIGKNYVQGEVCIPCATVMATNLQNPDSALVWGDFWVFNYKVVGDTLKMVSGGDHPGMMCIQKTADGGYKVTSFDRVVDGSGNVESAKRIFGGVYEAFHAFNSDEKRREEARAQFTAQYVKKHKLPVKYYQDYGWPAKKLPTTAN